MKAAAGLSTLLVALGLAGCASRRGDAPTVARVPPAAQGRAAAPAPVPLVVGAAGPGAAPGELVWFDRTMTFDGHQIPETSPLADWTKPTDYYNGTIQLRFVVKKKPTAAPVWLEIVMGPAGAGGPAACLACLPARALTSADTYTCAASPARPEGWACGPGGLDFTKPFGPVQHGARRADAAGGRGGALTGKDVPLVAHYTAVLVPAGQTFSGWDKYPVP